MDKVIESYENYNEENRLTTDNARKVEFITTVNIFDRLFEKNLNILDCAAGTGIYAMYLAEQGHNVTALDITPRHIDIINKSLKEKSYSMTTGVNDARNLSQYPEASFDVVLCMGPLYHLTEEVDRMQCLNECYRLLKKGGLLISAYINRFCVIPYIITQDFKFLDNRLIKSIRETGVLKHDDPLCFWTDTYYYIPEEIENLYLEMKLETIDHIATDGISLFIKDKINNMNNDEFKTWCDYHFSVCREKSIMGNSNHCLIIGRK